MHLSLKCWGSLAEAPEQGYPLLDGGRFVKANGGAADALSLKAAKAGAPTSVTLQVTDRCNYSCTHCFQEHVYDDELSTEEIFEILGQLADAGILFLTLMGGEFFMHPSADRILQKAHELGFAMVLKTTGHHISEKRADFLANIRPLQVDMSMYGAKPEVHEAITQQAGSWKRTFLAAKRLIERKVTVVLKAPIMESNSDEIASLTELANEIGADYSFDGKIIPVLDGGQSSLKLRMDATALDQFYRRDMAEFLKTTYEHVDSTKELRPLEHTPCRSAQQTCFINPQGEVWPCNFLPLPAGSLRKTSFQEIWFGSEVLADIRGLNWASISECNACEIRTYCQRCHGMAMVEDGEMRGPSLEACRHAVVVRDSLRERGLIPATQTQLPPTWDRIDRDGQHSLKGADCRGKRSRALRVLS